MKTFFRVVAFLFTLVFFITSCSRKKNTFVSRNMHALNTEYNILYNGNIALEKGRQDLNNAFTDNYWQVLPIERMQVFEEVTLPGQSKNADFQLAEEKAIKAVQKHGMNIRGREHNPQIDEAYLLLGQSRYFDQRFIPALEAFNYILHKYPASDKINKAKVWREKTNIRLENDELAIKNLKRLLEREELESQDLADATSILAQAYLNIKEKDSALAQLKIATAVAKKYSEKGRYNFIKGQIYNELGHKDSANLAFDEVIELHRKIPRPYYVNAHLAKAGNFDFENGNKLEFLEYLTDLEEDRENRPFLDKIYHRIAEYHKQAQSDTLAELYYNKSLRTNSSDNHLKALTYTTLGDMSFDKAKYKNAGAYYDSTMTSLKLNSKPYRVIKRKRENLDDVIYYEDVAQANDSILNLVNLSEAERLTYFTAFTEDLKAKVEALKEAEENKQINTGLETIEGNLTPNFVGNPTKQQQSFYFYNPTTVAFGENEFSKIWGNRELKDNWRVSSSSKGISSVPSPTDIIDSASDEERFDPDFYISKIPSDQKEIDSISKERNYAYYQLGTIYKEKFKKYILAKNRFKDLLDSNPEERLVLPSKYHLYKIYVELGMNDEAEIAKQDIITNHPDSRYAEILLNPNSNLSKDENSPESVYKKQYESFTNQDYLEVITNSETYINQFEGDPIVPKFEILKASAKGRLYGFEAYKESINFIALNYTNTLEGKEAERILSETIPVLSPKEFTGDDEVEKFNVIYAFDNNLKEEIEPFVEKLGKVISEEKFFSLKTSIDVYDENTIFVVIHGLKSIRGASGFAELLKENEDNPIEKEYFAISSPNYEIVQRHKNLNEYLNPE